MKLAKRFRQLITIPVLSGLVATAAHAHPGHIADNSIHGLLHSEHIIILVTAGVIAVAVYALRSK